MTPPDDIPETPLRRPLEALTTVLRGSAVPYGYTLTMLSTHSVIAHRHGSPSTLDVLLFVVGAIAAFALLGLLAEQLAPETIETGESDLIQVGIIHVVAIGAAFGAAVAIAFLPGLAAWALTGFAATGLYLGLASLEVLLARRLEPGEEAD